MLRWCLIGVNLALLVAFPVAWFAPLMRAGILPLFKLSEISVISGLQSLWDSDVFLALLVTVFALFAPYLKTIGLALVHFDLLSPKLVPVLAWLGKIETAYGLYLFTGCILVSLVVSALTPRILRPATVA